MYCKYCGSKNSDDSIYCEKCGKFLKKMETAGVDELEYKNIQKNTNVKVSNNQKIVVSGLVRKTFAKEIILNLKILIIAVTLGLSTFVYLKYVYYENLIQQRITEENSPSYINDNKREQEEMAAGIFYGRNLGGGYLPSNLTKDWYGHESLSRHIRPIANKLSIYFGLNTFYISLISMIFLRYLIIGLKWSIKNSRK